MFLESTIFASQFVSSMKILCGHAGGHNLFVVDVEIKDRKKNKDIYC